MIRSPTLHRWTLVARQRSEHADRKVVRSGDLAVTVGIVPEEDAEPDVLERWFSDDCDVRRDSTVGEAILALIHQHGVKTVVMSDRIIGCPHEEVTDYPEGGVRPQCPFWAHRDRWTGEVIQ